MRRLIFARFSNFGRGLTREQAESLQNCTTALVLEFGFPKEHVWEGLRAATENEPFSIPNLHGGQSVEVSEAEVFDYIRKFPDGTQEGNETGKVIERQAESGKSE